MNSQKPAYHVATATPKRHWPADQVILLMGITLSYGMHIYTFFTIGKELSRDSDYIFSYIPMIVFLLTLWLGSVVAVRRYIHPILVLIPLFLINIHLFSASFHMFIVNIFGEDKITITAVCSIIFGFIYIGGLIVRRMAHGAKHL